MDPEDERVPRIGEVKIKVNPDYYLEKALSEKSNGNDVLALENYLNYMENLPDDTEMNLGAQIGLTKLALNLGAALQDQEAEDEVMKCYIGILNHFPRNALILNAFGVYLFSKGEYNVPRVYFQRAAEEGYLPAEKNLLHVIWSLFPRWHIRMLNDKLRNEAFRRAITKAIKTYNCKTIMDIGTGSGLLALIASSCSKEAKITAFEENKTLYNTAKSIISDLGVTNIDLIEQNSNFVAEFSPKCDLIMTEIFDASLFGENCLWSLVHAHQRFAQNKCRIIPAGAKLYVTGIECPQLLKKNKYMKNLLDLRLKDVCLREATPEPYDCEYLKHFKVKYLTETRPFFDVDFYDRVQLKDSLLRKEKVYNEIELVCKESGFIHSFAVWFDLNLDEEITISTSPFASETCWEQAVYYLKHPVQVKKGERLKINYLFFENQLSFQLLSHRSDCKKSFEVSKEVITYLNDEALLSSIRKLAETYRKTDLNIVDFNIFPFFGLLMAKKGATVYHLYRGTENVDFFKYLMEINEISDRKFVLIHEKAVDDYLVYLEAPDLVFTDVIKTDGSWNKTEFTLEIESKLTCETLPKRIFLKAKLIFSKFLDYCNKVDDSNALNFNIAQHINEFTGTEHPNFDMFDYKECSSEAVFDINDSEEIDFHCEVDVICDETANGILYWFENHFDEDSSVVFSTLNSSHYNKTCRILNNLSVKKGNKLMVNVIRQDGHLKVYV